MIRDVKDRTLAGSRDHRLRVSCLQGLKLGVATLRSSTGLRSGMLDVRRSAVVAVDDAGTTGVVRGRGNISFVGAVKWGREWKLEQSRPTGPNMSL